MAQVLANNAVDSEASMPRGPNKAYLTNLEDRVERAEALLRRVRPNIDFTQELGPPIIRDSWKYDGGFSVPTGPYPPPGSSAGQSHTPTAFGSGQTMFSQPAPHPCHNPTALVSPRGSDDDVRWPLPGPAVSSENSSDADPETPAELVECVARMQKLSLRSSDTPVGIDDRDRRFHGKSSFFALVRTAPSLKDVTSSMKQQDAAQGTPSMRPRYWTTPEWELRYEGLVSSATLMDYLRSNMPPDDLCKNLIEIYFLHTNSQFPLFHKPTFLKHWASKLQYRNIWFASVCFGIFAVASRWSSDERVLSPNKASSNGKKCWYTAGRHFFQTSVVVAKEHRSVIYPTCLCEVQSLIVQAMYLRSTRIYTYAWIHNGVAIRKLQDVGAHRRRLYSRTPSIDDELWKRSWWCALLLDRFDVAGFGRPATIQDSDFDVEMPLEVDDEYWEAEDPTMAFKQPEGVPSRIRAFTLYIKLACIVSEIVTCLYTFGPKSRLELLLAPKSSDGFQRLNQELDDWLSSVDPFLEPGASKDFMISNWSTTLHATYHWTRMLIYRPFIKTPVLNRRNHCSYEYSEAMSICTEAARSLAVLFRRQQAIGISNIVMAINVAQISAANLLINVWDQKWRQAQEQRMSVDIKPVRLQSTEALMVDVRTFIEVLEHVSERWEQASSYLVYLRRSLPDAASLQPPLSIPKQLPALSQLYRCIPPTPTLQHDVSMHMLSNPRKRSHPAYSESPAWPPLHAPSINIRALPKYSSSAFSTWARDGGYYEQPSVHPVHSAECRSYHDEGHAALVPVRRSGPRSFAEKWSERSEPAQSHRSARPQWTETSRSASPYRKVLAGPSREYDEYQTSAAYSEHDPAYNAARSEHIDLGTHFYDQQERRSYRPSDMRSGPSGYEESRFIHPDVRAGYSDVRCTPHHGEHEPHTAYNDTSTSMIPYTSYPGPSMDVYHRPSTSSRPTYVSEYR
ncbi:hypothetical protein FISHEDRAFT_68311 [Fistulina hepatica ATCC 64428]|uniref:Xylanolytic transcriptional activator regulatory domain-containing protein n=1 Tax=Fistulina hepatica ATCC 64428 TaxID=1128425 RepID=A0A0D7ARH2_9AGAR|nr:hypothetical protein FISHEDRAFT_68311 [Fistulina hepatica ATCC 64428]